jgi:hypothetical protein
VTETKVFRLCQPGTFADPLTEVLRNGARALLAQPSEHELSMDALARRAASQSPEMNGMCYCATIILATSAGRSTRTIRSSP